MALINIQYTADISQLSARLDEIIAKQNQLIGSSKKAGDEIVNSTKRANSETAKLESTLSGLKTMIASAFSVGVILNFTKSLIDAERRLELIENRLNFVAGSVEQGTALFQRLTLAANRLGINIEVLSEGFASFGISATQAGFSARKAEEIFIKMSAGLRAAGATSLQSQRAFLALQQMIDKGVVSAEELRRQLAEALPGATSIMVEAYNNLHPAQQVTMEEFIKLQEAGKILSREILPEFANVLEKRLGPALAGKMNSLDASLEKITTQFFLLKTNITNTEFVKFFSNTFGDHLKRINAIINSESVPALEKLSRIMLEYIGLGSLNSSVIEKQMAKEQMAALASQKMNKQILDEAERLMELKKTAREEELKSLREEAASYATALEQAKKMNEERDAEIAKINQTYAALKRNSKSSNEAYFLEKQREKEVADVKAKYFDYEQSNQIKQKQTRLEVINGILEEVQSATEQEIKAEEAKYKEFQELEKQRLKDAVVLAKIRVEQAEKGSIEENEARANLAKKQGELDEFMAKSSAEMQLARVIAEKKANEQIEESRRKTEDVLSQEVVEDEIDPSKDPALKSIDKELEIRQKNSSKIMQAIAKPYLDAKDIEIAEATLKYKELIALTEENSEERKMLEEALQQEIDNIKDKYAEKDKKRNEQAIREIARMTSRVASEIAQISQSFADADREMMRNNLDASLNMLNAKLQAGLISESDYNQQVNDIRKRQFEIDQEETIAKIKVNAGLAIVKAFVDLPWQLAIAAGIAMVGLADRQIAAVKSQAFPTFHDGGIDIGGDAKKTSGPLKSDEFIAKLQRGESVIDRQDTRKYKDELSAIRDGRFEDYIASKYILPAIERAKDKAQPKSNMTSMEMAFQSAEMVNAIRGNKVIKLHKSSIKELAGQIKPKASDKILARRSFR